MPRKLTSTPRQTRLRLWKNFDTFEDNDQANIRELTEFGPGRATREKNDFGKLLILQHQDSSEIGHILDQINTGRGSSSDNDVWHMLNTFACSGLNDVPRLLPDVLEHAEGKQE